MKIGSRKSREVCVKQPPAYLHRYVWDKYNKYIRSGTGCQIGRCFRIIFPKSIEKKNLKFDGNKLFNKLHKDLTETVT